MFDSSLGTNMHKHILFIFDLPLWSMEFNQGIHTKSITIEEICEAFVDQTSILYFEIDHHI
jgi:hypothetical protein